MEKTSSEVIETMAKRNTAHEHARTKSKVNAQYSNFYWSSFSKRLDLYHIYYDPEMILFDNPWKRRVIKGEQ
jgi:uncharacterized membrane protein